ncbi:hypothetical protein IMSAG049_00636 [Clostridiales bacterium]|nr:hypothetical protein IMSAG049_00636 [Clostridiales bacterium]
MIEFIDKKIVINNLRRNYYTNSNNCPGNADNSNGVSQNGVNTNGINSIGVSPNSVNSSGVNPNGVGPNSVNSNRVNSNGVGPNSVNSSGVNPNGVSPNSAISNGVNPNGVSPNSVNPNRVNSNGVGPNGANSNGLNLIEVNSEEVYVETANANDVAPKVISLSNPNETAVTFLEPGGSESTVKSDVVYEESSPKAPNNPDELIPNQDNTSQLPNAYVRLYNFIPNGTMVNAYINGYTAKENMAPGTGTNFIKLPPGVYEIEFRASDDLNRLLSNFKLKALPGMSSTLAVTGSGNVYSVLDISGSMPRCFFNTAYLRFVQLAMNAPAMDIYVDGISVIAGIRFGEVSAFIGVPNGVHRIKVTAAGTGIVYIDETDDFPSGSISEIFISSNDGENYSLYIISDKNACS